MRDITERRLKEQKLQESEAMYRTFFENTGTGMLILEEDTTMSMVNTELERISGYSKMELEGKSWTEFVAKDYLEKMKEYHRLRRINPEAVPRNYETQFIGKQGNVRDILLTISMIPGTGKSLVSFVDITEHKKAEREVENLARYPAENPSPILRLDKNGVILHANKASDTLLKDWGKQIGNYAPKYWCDLVAELFESKSSRNVEVKSGKITYLFNVVPVLDYGYLNLYGRDITERKLMEEELRRQTEHLEELVTERTGELRESEERFRTIFDNAVDGIHLVSVEDKKFYDGNKAFCEMIGYSREELRNVGLVDIHPKESLPYVLQQFERVAKREITLAKDLPVKRRDGTVFYVDVNAIPTILGGKTYLVGVFRDITERKRMEEKLRKAERMAVIGETAAMVGHDLRNPLQVMVNRLFLAEKAAKNLSYPYSDVAEKLDLEGLFLDLEHQIEYMNKIVSDLQDYAKPIVPEMVEMNLRSLVEATFSTIEVPRNVIVSTELLKDVRLIVDAAMIRRVFSNIIMNALQAMPGGGKLEIRSLMSDDHVSVDFQDTGVGIPKENIDKIFIPLFTTKAKGTGLGLPVCKRLVEAHDGRIIVDSRVGEGTTVKIVLPIKPIGKGA